MLALRYDQPEIARLLLNRGADINAQDEDGWTPLFFALHFFPGAKVVSADDCSLAAQTICSVNLEVDTLKKEVFSFYRAELPDAGWTYDTSLSAKKEKGSRGEPKLWGMLNFTRNTDDRVTTATILIPSNAVTFGGPTQVNIVYQSHLRNWNPMQAMGGAPSTAARSYNEVIGTYPAGVELCTTYVEVTAINSDGQWSKMGIVQYRNHEAQVQCYGTRIHLKVAATLDGITYSAGTMLTVDANLNWAVVTDLGVN